jgi:hypothetical protein
VEADSCFQHPSRRAVSYVPRTAVVSARLAPVVHSVGDRRSNDCGKGHPCRARRFPLSVRFTAAINGETQALPVSTARRISVTVAHLCVAVSLNRATVDVRNDGNAVHTPSPGWEQALCIGWFRPQGPVRLAERATSRNSEGGVSASALPAVMISAPTGRKCRKGRLLQMMPRPASQPSRARAYPLTGRGLSPVSLAKSVR